MLIQKCAIPSYKVRFLLCASTCKCKIEPRLLIACARHLNGIFVTLLYFRALQLGRRYSIHFTEQNFM